MTATLMPNGKLRFYNAAGNVLVGGKLYTYSAGTVIPKATYVDQAATIPNANPVILDVRGEALVRWDGAYKYVLTDAAGVVIETIDDYTSPIVSLSAATGAGLIGFLYASVYGAGSVGKWLQDLALAAGSTFFGWIQAGAGAVLRTVSAKLRERVSVVDFGADPTGVAPSDVAINAAIASFGASAGTLFFPRGVYQVTASLLVAATQSGMVLQGESNTDTYLITPNGSVFDILKIAAAYCTVRGLFFRPGGTQYCMRIYAAHCTVEDNRFLAHADNVGTAVLATDVDPDTAAVIAGAYTHNFVNNIIGVAGFAFATGIDTSSTNGMQAMKFKRNQILSDRCLLIPKGGGNTYTGNLLQSATGGGVGIGIDLGAANTADKIFGNYMEGFAQGILLRNLSNANEVAYAVGNHFDNCTAPLTSLGTTNYVFQNPAGVFNYNGWIHNYSSATNQRWLTPSGGEGLVLTSGGLFQVGTTAGINHTLNTIGAAEAAIILTLQGAATSTAFFRHCTSVGANAANTCLSIKANSVTNRSINGTGTGNFNGTDYAEYMRRCDSCGLIAKGQIVGITTNGELSDKWCNSFSFCTKSTDPSVVGGDSWDREVGEQPEEPVRSASDSDDQWNIRVAEYNSAYAAWYIKFEEARAKVDRIAFAGQVPVNVFGAQLGDYIVPVEGPDGGIEGITVAQPTFDQYRTSVGRVIAIEEDGRARIIVKVA